MTIPCNATKWLETPVEREVAGGEEVEIHLEFPVKLLPEEGVRPEGSNAWGMDGFSLYALLTDGQGQQALQEIRLKAGRHVPGGIRFQPGFGRCGGNRNTFGGHHEGAARLSVYLFFPGKGGTGLSLHPHGFRNGNRFGRRFDAIAYHANGGCGLRILRRDGYGRQRRECVFGASTWTKRIVFTL